MKKKTVDVAQEKENLSRDSMINDGKKLGVKETAIIEPSEEETIGETAEYSASFVQTEYNGHMYQLFNEGVSWSTAESRCEEKGAHLVTITSEREYDFCKTLLGDMSSKYCWMGATHSSGSWKWITGESWGFTAWSPSQPNGSGGGTYALMQNFKGVDAAWNWDDQENSETSPSEKYQGSPYFHLTENYCYICEWERTVTGVEVIIDDYQKADRKICITWDGILKNLKYEVQYSSTKDFKQNVVSEKVSREEGEKVDGYTTKALERLKTYYFRVRLIYRLSDKDFPGGWSDVITAKTTNSLLSSELWGFDIFSDPFSEYYFERFFTHDSAVRRSSKNNMNGKDGLCIQYSSRSDFKTQKTVTVNNAKTVSKTISGLAKKHKYYVRVRTYKKRQNQPVILSHISFSLQS